MKEMLIFSVVYIAFLVFTSYVLALVINSDPNKKKKRKKKTTQKKDKAPIWCEEKNKGTKCQNTTQNQNLKR